MRDPNSGRACRVPARAFLLVAAISLAWPALAVAQSWELDLHGGLAIGRTPNAGSKTSPAAGATFLLADGVQQTRAVSSWFFGDGAALFNQVMQLRGVTTHLTPLDESGWPRVVRRTGMEFGARLTRVLGHRLGIEGAIEAGVHAIGFNQAGLDRIEATRAQFAAAFLAMNGSSTALQGNPTITATKALVGGQGTELITTASLVYRGDIIGTSQVYVLAGAGVATLQGQAPSVTLVGHYRLTSQSQIAFDETDTMTLRSQIGVSPVGVVGGGVRRRLSPRAALKIDARILMNSNGTTLALSTQPAVASGTPGAVVLNLSNPGLQFSTRSDIRTNLSAEPISDFQVFSASGLQMRFLFSVGYVRTF